MLGTWLGLRQGGVRRSTYRVALAVAVLYGVASFLGNVSFHTGIRTVTIPSHEENILGLQVFFIATLWGIGAPYVIAVLVRRIKLLGVNDGTKNSSGSGSSV
jgi:hypothetical protein